jgi:hypothetical protein
MPDGRGLTEAYASRATLGSTRARLDLPTALISCPADSSSPAKSTALTNCTCKAGWSGPNAGTCMECVAGTYKSAAGSTDCISCPSNSNSSAGSAMRRLPGRLRLTYWYHCKDKLHLQGRLVGSCWRTLFRQFRHHCRCSCRQNGDVVTYD